MKTTFSLIALVIAFVGSFKIGAYYQEQRDFGLVPWAMQQQQETDRLAWQQVDHVLYDWKRPIRASVYIGCMEKRPMKFSNVIIDGTDFDYGIWIGCNEGTTALFDGTIEIGKPVAVMPAVIP